MGIPERINTLPGQSAIGVDRRRSDAPQIAAALFVGVPARSGRARRPSDEADRCTNGIELGLELAEYALRAQVVFRAEFEVHIQE